MKSKIQRLLPFLPINIAATAILIPIFLVQSQNYDTQYHIFATQQLIDNGKFIYPHFLFHIILAAAYYVAKINFEYLAAFVQLIFALFYINIGFAWLRSLDITSSIASVLILVHLIYNPIAILYPIDHRIYFGYIYANTFHNPTIWVLRPFALALFILAVKLCNDGYFKPSTGFLSLTTAILACLAKPNMTLVLLPGMVLLMIIKKMKATTWLSALWIILPSLACLTFQYCFTFGNTPAGGGITWQPFAVMGMFSQHLIIKFFLSTAFPLAVILLFPDKALRWIPIQLAWLIFIFGSLLVYSLNETSGLSGGAGNFGWSAQIGLLLLFFTSSALLAKERPLSNWRVTLCIALLAMHLVSGSIFYLTELTARQMQFW